MLAKLLSTGPAVIGMFLLMNASRAGTVHAAKEQGFNTQPIVAGNTEFAIDLYHRLRTGDENLFFSPHSISTALAMTYAGARGETASQMSDVLHFPSDQSGLHAGFETLEQSLIDAGTGQECVLRIANALWGREGEPFRETFVELIGEHYGGRFTALDFLNATEQARRKINQWVTDHTEQKIVGLLKKNDVRRDTVLVLTNAIYLKGAWSSRFDPDRTTVEGAFHVSASHSVVAPMMHQLGRFAYASVDDAHVLELPFESDRLSMVIVLPKQTDGLADIEQSLSRDQVDSWLAALHEQPVRVTLPRFSLESRFDLAGILGDMGMPKAFGAGADFSGISEAGGLFISNVIHQARVDVSEEGAEAAGATAVIMKRSATAAFVADHPFLLLIRDKQTASVLFMGRVTNPTG